jgi:hypothetical protein
VPPGDEKNEEQEMGKNGKRRKRRSSRIEIGVERRVKRVLT